MKGWNVENFILPLAVCIFQGAGAAELKGMVSDGEGHAVDFASISVYTADTVLVAGAMCDESGFYAVE